MIVQGVLRDVSLTLCVFCVCLCFARRGAFLSHKCNVSNGPHQRYGKMRFPSKTQNLFPFWNANMLTWTGVWYANMESLLTGLLR